MYETILDALETFPDASEIFHYAPGTFPDALGMVSEAAKTVSIDQLPGVRSDPLQVRCKQGGLQWVQCFVLSLSCFHFAVPRRVDWHALVAEAWISDRAG